MFGRSINRLGVRLALWNGLLGILLLAVFIAGSTIFALAIIGKQDFAEAQMLRREAPQVAAAAIKRDGSLERAAPSIARALARPGIRIIVFNTAGETLAREPAGGMFGSPGMPPGPPRGANGGQMGGPGTAFGRVEVRLRPGLAPPVDIPGGRIAVFPVPKDAQEIVINNWLLLLELGLPLTVLTALLGMWITNRAIRPLESVTEGLKRLAEGNYSQQSFISMDRDEIGALTNAFNAASAHVSGAIEERERVEREMRAFIAEAGHELRTPVTVLLGYIDVMKRGALEDRTLAARILETMGTEGVRMRDLVENLLLLARLDEPAHEVGPVNVTQLVREVIDAARPFADGTTLRIVGDAPVYVQAERRELREAISNLVDNALKYSDGTAVDAGARADGDHVIVTVRDDGKGMTAHERAHAFDRFFRGDQRGEVEGSGLGLAIVKKTVERAGGNVDLESSPGAGTIVTLTFKQRTPP